MSSNHSQATNNCKYSHLFPVCLNQLIAFAAEVGFKNQAFGCAQQDVSGAYLRRVFMVESNCGDFMISELKADS